MIRITLLTVIASLIFSGWVCARQQEMLNHPHDLQMQEMQSTSCNPTSDPTGAG